MMTGVLAVQGDFAEHEKMLDCVGEEYFEIRRKSDLSRHFDRLILPGGESTVQSKLIRDLDMLDDLKAAIDNGVPVLATCAGLILLAERLSNDSRVCLGTLPVTVRRNAYGRQLGSFFTEGEFADMTAIPMEFIRAPFIESASDGVDVLSVVRGNIVAVRYRNQLAMAYHPELCGDTRIYEYFLNM